MTDHQRASTDSIDSVTYNPARSADELLDRWLRRLRESQFIHYEEAARLRRWNYYLGVPVVILTAIVGTSVFSSLSSSEGIGEHVRMLIGAVSIISAVLASLQTFLGFAERAEKHRATAARYGISRREVEALIAEGDLAGKAEQIAKIRAGIDNLALDAPNVSNIATRKSQHKIRNWRHN